MKEVAILLLVALMLNGCGSTTPTVQSASGGIWQSAMLGGEGPASGLSFITQFTVANSGAISVSNFQFLNSIPGGCFLVIGEDPSGILLASYNTADQVVPPFTFTFTVVSGGNTLTLTGTSMTGQLNTTTDTLSNGVIMGNWTVTGGTGCNNVSGTFTMTQTTS